MTSISLCRSLVVNKLAVRMASTKFTYEEAVHKLNSLQSNKATIEQIRKDIRTGQKCTNLEDMENFLYRIGVTLSMLDELSVIHVAGTKGKGSTSAMCESILRHHGYRTGFYSSPHLVAVRERIRLDGRVITSDKFAKHFHEVYNMLDSTKAYEGDMPKYFSFLTVLAFNVFLKEKVDVAIVEVGIGGIVDYTNVLRKVPVVGITALGLDHTSILGNTIEQIAAAKAGIMKPGCEAYTVPQQPEAMEVLKTVAANKKCPLYIVPHFEKYTFPNDDKSKLPINLEAYQSNGSLALQLSHAWMRISTLQLLDRKNISQKQVVAGKIIRQNDFVEINSPYIENDKIRNVILNEEVLSVVPEETAQGLIDCKWPGRYQVIQTNYATVYLDGAHTRESMEICVDWFRNNNRFQDKMLIFSATGDRDAEILLKPLKDIGFKTVFFVIPTAYKEINEKNDNYSIVEHRDLITRCQTHAKIWKQGITSSITKVIVSECVSDALINIKNNYDGSNVSILITGSLHLVGATLSIIDPNLNSD